MTRTQFSFVVSHMCSAAALVVAAGSLTGVLAQTPAADGHHQTVTAPNAAPSAAMMGEQKEMMAKMAADDKKLADLIARMNAAKGSDKVDAMAAVITELSAQRSQMQQHMMQMHARMMEQMMSHMSAMQGGGMMKKEPPPPAPKDQPAEPDHSAHHPGK